MMMDLHQEVVVPKGEMENYHLKYSRNLDKQSAVSS